MLWIVLFLFCSYACCWYYSSMQKQGEVSGVLYAAANMIWSFSAKYLCTW